MRHYQRFSFIPSFTITSCLLSCMLWGEIKSSTDINQSMVNVSGISSEQLFTLDADFEHFNNARLSKSGSYKKSHLSLSSINALVSYEGPATDKSACYFGAGYQGMNFDFTNKAPFSQKQFNNGLFNIGGYTKAIDRWKWKGDLLAQISTDHFALSRYTFLTGLLKGKYDWHKKRFLHVGVLAYAGMRYSRALPVLGFDYIPNESWKVSIIYPLHMYVQYNLNKNWSVQTGLRYFLTRQRMGDEHKLPRGFVAFRTWGAEIGVNYVVNDRIKINAHIGETLSSRMRVSNRNDRHRKHFKLDNAPGFGLIASIAI